MQLRCVLVSPDPASASLAEPPRSTTGRWMHDASAFAVTLETKLHRPTDLQACVEEEGLGWWIGLRDRLRLHRLFSPGGEMCTVGWSSVERGFV